jgi:hypothetical protein
MEDINLPDVIDGSNQMLEELTEELGVPRSVLANNDDIYYVWSNLPRFLSKIPHEQRSEGLVKMCVAVKSGLFDSAINYIWNESIRALREKVRQFGLNVVGDMLEEDFNEEKLIEYRDAKLLSLCLKLNLINEEAYFYLDQCREIRNNFSAAHPPSNDIREAELINFISRCVEYALSNTNDLVGVDIQKFIDSIKGSKFNEKQKDQWVERLSNTHEEQQKLLFGTLHGIYCDPNSSEEARVNSIYITKEFADKFTSKIKSELINRNKEYLAKGKEKRHKASVLFFKELGLLELLSDQERHHIISENCQKLLEVHQDINNFYNEPPFAERLYEITKQGNIPETVKEELVESVVTCAVGNKYGVSRKAFPYYKNIIKNFSPKEVSIMLELPKRTKTKVGWRIENFSKCKNKFEELIQFISEESVPVDYKNEYENWK